MRDVAHKKRRPGAPGSADLALASLLASATEASAQGPQEPAEAIENVMRSRWRARDALGYLLGLALFILLLLLIKAYRLDETALPQLSAAVTSLGIFGPLLYVGAFVVAALLLFPATLMMATGALIFPNIYEATIYAMVGATTGATAAMLVGRRLGKRFAARFLGDRMQQLEEFANDHGFMAVLSLRLTPVPYGFTNYGAGLSKTRLGDFVPATLIGMVPHIFTVVYFTKSAASIQSPSDVLNPGFLLPLLFFLGVASLPLFYRRYKKGRGQSDNQEE